MALLTTHAHSRPRHRGWLLLCRLAGLLCLASCSLAAATTPAETPREYQVKAVFVFHFTQFVEWPAAAFSAPDAPFVIAVLGDDPFHGALEEVTRGEHVQGHPIVIRRCQTIADAAGAHILFVGQTGTPKAEEIAASFHHRPSLTVGDGETFAQRGGVICFVTERNKIRFRINLDAARDAGLIISSKLLRAAEVIGSPTAKN